jgi:hypothetical protein
VHPVRVPGRDDPDPHQQNGEEIRSDEHVLSDDQAQDEAGDEYRPVHGPAASRRFRRVDH